MKTFTSTKYYEIIGSWYGHSCLGEMCSNVAILFSSTFKNTPIDSKRVKNKTFKFMKIQELLGICMNPDINITQSTWSES